MTEAGPLAPLEESRKPGWKGTVSRAWARLTIYPFEAAIGVYLIISGIASVAGYGQSDPVGALLPAWLAGTLNALTVLAGTAILAGTASALRRVETAGLVFLLGVITCRFILYGVYLGFGARFVTTGIFDAATTWAALARLHTIRAGHAVVRVIGPVRKTL